MISPQELIEDSLEKIEGLNEVFHAYLTINPRAVDQAQQCEDELKSGQWRGPLHGIPISIKDLIQTADLPTTAGSKVVSARISYRKDATLIKNLREAGAIILGKTNLHEFAYGVTTENSHFGTAINPWDNRVVAGGSSGGSAVSAATGMCQGSVGTDTRGSIRIPAAACGVTGFKPTVDKVPMSGIIPLSPSLDHAGPIARSVEMAALLVSCMAQDESLDPYRFPYEPPPSSFQMGVSTYHMDKIDPEINQSIWEAIDIFQQAGISIKPVSIDGIEDALHASTVITSVEALRFHRPLMEKQPEAYGPKVLERLEAGKQYSAADLAAAQRTQKRITSSFTKAFQEVNCLIGATLPCLPPRLGTDSLQITSRAESVVDAFTRLNAPQNLSGIPALALPCGFSKTGLPLSMQIIGSSGHDRLVLQVGHFYQNLTDWHRKKPSLSEHFSEGYSCLTSSNPQR
jgi:aspartyl-tRNA(Asn)/glutamyl-tRNA(Gln) amidotransferase subunit A